MRFLASVFALLLAAATLPAVAGASLRVVATTSMVTDLVRQVAGEHARVEGLMGPGVDPHLYKPVAADVLKLQRADLIFYNGLQLEGKMTDLLQKLERANRRVHAVTNSIPRERLLRATDGGSHLDPHVWFDVELWRLCLDEVEKALSAADPENATDYRARAGAARLRFDALHSWAKAELGKLPAERRVLVTSHDAYGYFGRAYGVTVIGLQGISTASEAGLADVVRLTDFIRSRGVRAIFVESSVPHTTIERVSADSGAKIGGELFSDAMGTPGTIENGYDLGTYEGMIRHNVTTIVRALE